MFFFLLRRRGEGGVDGPSRSKQGREPVSGTLPLFHTQKNPQKIVVEGRGGEGKRRMGIMGKWEDLLRFVARSVCLYGWGRSDDDC